MNDTQRARIFRDQDTAFLFRAVPTGIPLTSILHTVETDKQPVITQLDASLVQTSNGLNVKERLRQEQTTLSDLQDRIDAFLLSEPYAIVQDGITQFQFPVQFDSLEFPNGTQTQVFDASKAEGIQTLVQIDISAFEPDIQLEERTTNLLMQTSTVSNAIQTMIPITSISMPALPGDLPVLDLSLFDTNLNVRRIPIQDISYVDQITTVASHTNQIQQIMQGNPPDISASFYNGIDTISEWFLDASFPLPSVNVSVWDRDISLQDIQTMRNEAFINQNNAQNLFSTISDATTWVTDISYLTPHIYSNLDGVSTVITQPLRIELAQNINTRFQGVGVVRRYVNAGTAYSQRFSLASVPPAGTFEYSIFPPPSYLEGTVAFTQWSNDTNRTDCPYTLTSADMQKGMRIEVINGGNTTFSTDLSLTHSLSGTDTLSNHVYLQNIEQNTRTDNWVEYTMGVTNVVDISNAYSYITGVSANFTLNFIQGTWPLNQYVVAYPSTGSYATSIQINGVNASFVTSGLASAIDVSGSVIVQTVSLRAGVWHSQLHNYRDIIVLPTFPNFQWVDTEYQIPTASHSSGWITMAYGYGRYIIGQYDIVNSVKESTNNGQTWTTITEASVSTTRVRDIQFYNGVFIIINQGDNCHRSTNGINWETIAISSGGGTANWRMSTYGNNVWVAVGQTSSGSKRIARSTDNGNTWSSVSLSFNPQNPQIAYGNNRFIISHKTGFTVSTDNGITWTNMSTSIEDRSNPFIMYANGKFLSTGKNGVIYSLTDGSDTWNYVTQLMGIANDATTVVVEIKYGGGMYVATSGGGILNTPQTSLYTWVSSDGTYFVPKTPVFTDTNLIATTYAQGKFSSVVNGHNMMEATWP